MKAIKIFMLMLAIISVCAISACAPDEEKEATGYNGEWYYNSTYHWRDPDENGDDWKSEHNFINDVCNLCGYSRKTTSPGDNTDPDDGSDDDPSGEKPSTDKFGQGETVVDGLSFTRLYGEKVSIGYSVGVGDMKTAAQIEIPSEYNGERVVAIDDYGFSNLSSLKDITIPDSITAIGYEAFAHCTALQKVVIPNSVTFMDHRAFLGCTSLTDVTLSDKLTTLNAKAFYRCTALKKIEFPEGLVSIQKEVFSRCTSLETVIIPKSLEKIDSSVFFLCDNVTKVVAWDIDHWMNMNIQGLESNPITSGANLYFISSGHEELLTELNVPEGTKSVNGFLFAYCNSLKKVYIPDSVTEIGLCTFMGCSQLTEIKADGVKVVQAQTFSEMPALTTISLKGAETVERDAFFKNSKLKTIYFGKNLVSLGQRCCYETSLDDLYFDGGTKEQWDSVFKFGESGSVAGNAWNYGVGDYTVHYEGGSVVEHGREWEN